MKKICLFLVLATIVSTLQAQKNKNCRNGCESRYTAYGIFSAPTGTNIILQNNAKGDLSLVAGRRKRKKLYREYF
jgi:hypothetical protein